MVSAKLRHIQCQRIRPSRSTPPCHSRCTAPGLRQLLFAPVAFSPCPVQSSQPWPSTSQNIRARLSIGLPCRPQLRCVQPAPRYPSRASFGGHVLPPSPLPPSPTPTQSKRQVHAATGPLKAALVATVQRRQSPHCNRAAVPKPCVESEQASLAR